MEGGLNITYIVFDGHVDVKRYRYIYFVIILMIYILIVGFNSTIVCLIVIHKNLHNLPC